MPTGAEAQRKWRQNNLGYAAKYAKNYRTKSPETGAQWRRENKERLKAYTYDWRRRNLAASLLANMKRSAKQRGQECTLTKDEIRELCKSMQCAVTGLPLVWKGPDRTNPWAPSPDRINPMKGYVLGNVRIVCGMYNRARGCHTDEEVRIMAEALMRTRSNNLGG